MVLIDLKMVLLLITFSGHNVGDVGSNDYKLSIDMARGEARTYFNEDNVELGGTMMMMVQQLQQQIE